MAYMLPRKVSRLRNQKGRPMLSKFLKDENGATAIEYGLIATLIALAVIAGAQLAGQNLLAKFNEIAGKLV